MKKAGYIGISLHELKAMSNREFTMFLYGRQKKSEDLANFEYIVAKYGANKIAQAVWADRGFKEKPPKVDFTSGILNSSAHDRIIREQRATLDRIKRQYGVDLTEVANNG